LPGVSDIVGRVPLGGKAILASLKGGFLGKEIKPPTLPVITVLPARLSGLGTWVRDQGRAPLGGSFVRACGKNARRKINQPMPRPSRMTRGMSIPNPIRGKRLPPAPWSGGWLPLFPPTAAGTLVGLMLAVGVIPGAVAVGDGIAVGEGAAVGVGIRVGVGRGVGVGLGTIVGDGVGVWQGKRMPHAYAFFAPVRELKVAIPNSTSARIPIVTRKKVKREVALCLTSLPRSRCWEKILAWSKRPDPCLFFFIAEILSASSLFVEKVRYVHIHAASISPFSTCILINWA
jgi:hypothetical protein